MRADRLRFGEVPDTEVRFAEGPGVVSGSGSERENLPDAVQADVRYDDVLVRYTLASRIDDENDDQEETEDHHDAGDG
ncbi:hypothetical protein [Streptomyces otsuchiensis]|uniref:hypothetical protein n=1 Tax=Streptomyces otsuchiensis TaxID=2681388 RepID=UPI001D1320A8|nr:hypothetical protein [Streptomyces otsuchiensis]